MQISYAAGIKIRSKSDEIEGLKAKVGYPEVSDKNHCRPDPLRKTEQVANISHSNRK